MSGGRERPACALSLQSSPASSPPRVCSLSRARRSISRLPCRCHTSALNPSLASPTVQVSYIASFIDAFVAEWEKIDYLRVDKCSPPPFYHCKNVTICPKPLQKRNNPQILRTPPAIRVCHRHHRPAPLICPRSIPLEPPRAHASCSFRSSYACR